ncbi:hypothetical protein F3Y22_tig00110467pilonHSYRG00193 [Hibiscus syriacus]|uniref:Uncharacterized protein n=1 Tax=Hibiscus syriacus TaxID=106335 RepID=A0A6A3AGG3_HIBSY|nr:hypothetical protein F3Y22_tig00110467pilonHSYRG00193 [Hibiscus syriacus]
MIGGDSITSLQVLNVLKRRLMAAAEAREVWQRTANRCFVQEDAKRAPKLACCQSSSSSKQAYSSLIGVAGAHDQPAPSNGPQKGSTNELLNALEDGVESYSLATNPKRVQQKGSAETMKNCELLEMESIECDVSKKTNDFSYDLGSPWVGGGKAEPWWRVTDKDELASLVAKKSLDFIENCDLPPPQKMHIRRCALCFQLLVLDFVEQVTESDPTKPQLLEVLRQSQIRAREAEKTAKQTYAEKEHVIKLIVKQASQIYSYTQWFKMLHLDVYLQIKNNEQPVSTLFPLVLPWTSYDSCKSRGKGGRRKQSQPRPSITTCAVAFALGLSLVSAGLLLGWTVGRMLPF